jgi:hypothetical protein
MKPDHEKTGVADGLAVAEVVMAAAGDEAVTAAVAETAIKGHSRQTHALPMPFCWEGRLFLSLSHGAVSISPDCRRQRLPAG